MAIALVQQAGTQTPLTTSVTATLGADPTPGNLLIAAVKLNDGVASTMTPPDGFTWVSNAPLFATARQLGVAWKIAAAADTTTLTATSSSAQNMLIQAWEVSGITDAGAFGVQTATGATSTSKQLTTTGTLPQANTFVVAICDTTINNGGEVSVNSGFTLRNTGTFDLWMVADVITSATTALAPTFTWTTSRQNMGFQAVFLEGTPVTDRVKYRASGAWVLGTKKYRDGGAWTTTPTEKYRSGGAWT